MFQMYTDPITGKMYLGERRDKGMEIFVDPETGMNKFITFVSFNYFDCQVETFTNLLIV